MKKLLTVCILLGAIVFLVSPVFAQTQNVFRVDAKGNITLNGQVFRLKGGSWTGLEGRSVNYSEYPGNPMEMYMGNMSWAESGRTYDSDIAEFRQMGFNVIRIPIVPQTLDANNPDGKEPYLTNAQSVRIQNARLALEYVIKRCNSAGLFVILDIDSCSNNVGWRAGRFDARPPYVDSDWQSSEKGECSCAATNNPSSVRKIQAYDVSKWLDNLKTLANFATTLNVTNIMGIDIFNEPWDYTWDEWKSYIDQAYQAINSVNPSILIFAQGVGSSNGNQDGIPGTNNMTPYGTVFPNWGENFYEAGDNLPSMPKERLVFAPHCFGPSMAVMPHFLDPNQPECQGLQGDAAGDAKCNIVINQALLEQGWEAHFGYLKSKGYAICIGAFGGNPNWPNKAEPVTQKRYSYLTDKTTDWKWQQAFVAYLSKKRITDTIYWSLNPESDLGGIYTSPYDPTSNTGGWGTWATPDQKKLTLLKILWEMEPVLPTPTPTTSVTLGDANGDGNIDIVDALLVARYAVGLTDVINVRNADANCDGSVTILDALLIAQYAVGAITKFPCSL